MSKFLFVLLAVVLVYGQYNPDLGKIFAQLTVSSYCPERSIDAWNCTPCKLYPHLTHVKRFRNASNDTVGYIAIDDSKDATILVFRGTMPFDIKNWIVDINFLKRNYPLCSNGCQVHEGFYLDYLEIQDQVKSSVANYTALYKKSNIFVTGHSLGGALATHAVAHLISLNYTVNNFYTLGSPRVGDNLFQRWFNTIFQDKFKARITHNRDPVPHLPQMDWGFRHLTNEIFYNEPSTSYKVCSSTNSEDPNCSDQFVINGNIQDHLSYFAIDYNKQTLLCQFN